MPTPSRRFGGLPPLAWGIVACALLVRVVVVLTVDPRLSDDPADYHRLAVSVADGDGFGESVLAAGGGATAFRPPLYPALLGGLYAIVGDKPDAARLVQAGLGALAVLLLYLLVDRVAGRRAALVAAAIAAVHPPLIVTGSNLLTEPVFLPMMLGALLLALRYRDDPRMHWPLLAGLLVGAAVLTRPVGLAVLTAVAVLVRGGRGRWRAPAVAVVAAAVVVLPWSVRNYVATDHFIPVSNEDSFILAGVFNDDARTDADSPALWRPPVAVAAYEAAFRDPELEEAELAEELRADAIDYALDHPAYVAESFGRNLLRLYDLDGRSRTEEGMRFIGFGPTAADLSLAAYAVVAILAVVGATRPAARRVPGGVWIVPLLVTVITAPVLGTTRYRMPIEPFLILLAGIAVAAVWDRRPAPAEAGASATTA